MYIKAIIPKNKIRNTNIEVSCIVVTRNRVSNLVTCVRSIAWQSQKNKEIIIVDDASNDNTFKVVLKLFNDNKVISNFERLVYIRLDRETFKARAINIGIKFSKGKYVAIIDDDNILHSKALEEMIKVIEKDHCLAVGSISIDPITMKAWSTGVKIIFPGIKSRYPIQKRSFYEVDSLQNVFIFKRELFNILGPWDSEKIIFQDEDEDFLQRVRKTFGSVLCIASSAYTFHITPKITSRLRNYIRAYFFLRSRPLIIKRYFPIYWYLALIFFFPIIVLLHILRLWIKRSCNFKCLCYILRGALDGVIISFKEPRFFGKLIKRSKKR